MITVAPDAVPPAAITALARPAWRCSLGHSDAAYEQARAGARCRRGRASRICSTRCRSWSPARPALVGAALADGSAYAGIIVDGHHVHPAAVRAAFAANGAARLFLVSDAMATAASATAATSCSTADHPPRDGRLTDDAGNARRRAPDRWRRRCATPCGWSAFRSPTRCAWPPPRRPPACACTIAAASRPARGPISSRSTASSGVIAVWQGGVRI